MSTQDRAISAGSPFEVPAHEDWHLKTSAVLSVLELAELNVRSDRAGWRQLAAHLTVMGSSGAIWSLSGSHLSGSQWWLAIPALVVYGFSLASMFAAMHECAHRTAFAHPQVNDAVSWLAGVLSFYNSTFYRRYHKWHHRYTQIPGKDPELEDAMPTSWGVYLWQISGIPWWVGKIRGHWRGALGQFEGCPYISAAARNEVSCSIRWQLAVYGVAIALSVVGHHPWFITYWLLPLVVGQPILRLILLSEHRGCTEDDNPLTNTRTTHTFWLIRLLMWNMPYHAEHHLYASIPFHALPQAHEKLAAKFKHVAPGYVAVQRELTARFGKVA
ncbi:MAG: fatty acid desaturase family protein [Leptolyngbyaceae cyanobacterium bins.349]|nr:fatty acid desaturase family protein [Leptolyngbyaceae cyanobacterium bins.349]